MKNRLLLTVSAFALGTTGCAGVPGFGGPEAGAPLSQGERQQGAQAHPQLLEQFGGTYDGAQSAYVTRVGQRIAVQSGLADSQAAFTISLLNSPVENAFAIPGGYVYVTRNLVGLMNNEA
ncbi:MAG: M48 family metalloprotease, partial [Sphingomonadales bacterium]|nr:M48 family metalloprotease [Sphingomonadales bacterium]